MSDNPYQSVLYIASATILLLALFIFPIPITNREIAKLNYATIYEDDSNIELGDTQTKTPGVDGKKEVTYRSSGTLLQRMFNPDSVEMIEVDYKVIEPATSEIVANGTKKYRFMHCTDGSYRSYTEEQFQNPNIGFTSKSPDYCANSGNGSKVRLSNSPPSYETTCVDVTSIDWNWNNDVLCTNPDGSSYYTSYEGAGWY